MNLKYSIGGLLVSVESNYSAIPDCSNAFFTNVKNLPEKPDNCINIKHLFSSHGMLKKKYYYHVV